MGHLEGDDQRELDISLELTVLEPRGLVDEFLLSLFLNGIGIDIVFFQQSDELGAGRLGMTIEKVLTDESFAASAFLVKAAGFDIHVKDIAVDIADGDGARQFFKVFIHLYNQKKLRQQPKGVLP